MAPPKAPIAEPEAIELQPLQQQRSASLNGQVGSIDLERAATPGRELSGNGKREASWRRRPVYYIGCMCMIIVAAFMMFAMLIWEEFEEWSRTVEPQLISNAYKPSKHVGLVGQRPPGGIQFHF